MALLSLLAALSLAWGGGHHRAAPPQGLPAVSPAVGASALPAPSLLPGSLPEAPSLALPAAELAAVPAPSLPAAAETVLSAVPAAVLPARTISSEDPLPGQAALPAARAELEAGAEGLREAGRSDPAGPEVAAGLDELFSGRLAIKKGRGRPAPTPPGFDGSPIVNDDGVTLLGRAAAYYRKAEELVRRNKKRMDLSETLGVMNDSYADVWAKLTVLEHLGREGRGAAQYSNHLPGTLIWIDALYANGGRRTAVHTHRVYFHKAANPRSEIEEGSRRVAREIDDLVYMLRPGGHVEEQVKGGPLDEVVLAFDARGYPEIKDAIRAKFAAIERQHPRRFRFLFVDELAPVPASDHALRQDLNALTARYKRNGLEHIIEGVIYSRYVGLLLELQTLEHYADRGYAILQSGRELFDEKGLYITELDAVVRSRQGRVALVEARSMRTPMSMERALKKRILYKLDAYARNWDLLDRAAGARIDEVVFAVDVGAREGLADFLRAKEPELSAKYGRPVSFLFLAANDLWPDPDAPKTAAPAKPTRKEKASKRKRR